ncbi:electron transport complex subunit RsxB [Marinagarivorans cellulosilyticus]|uniref:Ion-translocating oxidoreductase complex subunit B n=1 Tax=Marinagarivorans cellulosilyticus TaxID=2721545 RepID=A0AAN1WI52_9GAMM|nr:electron transport complex subunit RsxB [Marinagarivorans cellulosilyticus]BCD97994.1 Na+-translocating ferredoxin:NAD+ oxidoreductase subunit B [Marinagarivorans cellulosilyticus]
MLHWIIDNPVLGALLVLAALSLVFGAILGFAAVKYKVEGDPLVEQVDALLPQTQCGQCGHPGCRPYAQAIVAGEAINHCPPGGQSTINNLADLLGVEAPSLDEEHGEATEIKQVAFIREEDCIGCTKCIQACPVDAILGAQKKMHTVIESECTGCDLCVEPCPVDCIDLLPVEQGVQQWVWDKPQTNIIATDRPAPKEAVA